MSDGNYPPGMHDEDWRYTDGDHLVDDDEMDEIKEEETVPVGQAWKDFHRIGH